MMYDIRTPTPLSVSRAQNTLLQGAYWPAGLDTRTAYARRQDDTDGQDDISQYLEVSFGPDGDAWVIVAGAPPLRFRTHAGGGQSWHTRNALMLLAEAIKRDNETAPQHRRTSGPAPAPTWCWTPEGMAIGELELTPEALVSLADQLQAGVVDGVQLPSIPANSVRSAEDVHAILGQWIPDSQCTLTSEELDIHNPAAEEAPCALAWAVPPHHGREPLVQLRGPVPPVVFFALAYWLRHPDEFEPAPA